MTTQGPAPPGIKLLKAHEVTDVRVQIGTAAQQGGLQLEPGHMHLFWVIIQT